MQYRRWTPTAIECYERKCICTGCPTKELIETKCRMKECVADLLDKFGEPPNFMTDDIFPDMSDKQREIIEAILEGATTSEQIAEKLNTTRSNAIAYLNQLYKKAEITGCTFSKKSGRLPEFVEFINDFVKKKEQEKKMSNFIDEDLKIEYPPYLASVVKAIKEGAEMLSVIAYRAQKKRGTTSVMIDDLHKLLVKQNLILPNDKSKREQIIDFIQSRLLDKDYSQCGSGSANSFPLGSGYMPPAPKPLTESKNSDEITALKEENERLKNRVRELEQQPPQTFNISGLRLKLQNEIEHLQQKLNALDVFEQEFLRSENAQ